MKKRQRMMNTEYLEMLAGIKNFDAELWLTPQQIQEVLREVIELRHKKTKPLTVR